MLDCSSLGAQLEPYMAPQFNHIVSFCREPAAMAGDCAGSCCVDAGVPRTIFMLLLREHRQQVCLLSIAPAACATCVLRRLLPAY